MAEARAKAGAVALWIVSILLAALFLFSGGMKLLQPAQTKAMFAQMGYAAWFATFIGICEVLGGLGLLLPRLAGWAAAGLSVIMVGAFFTMALHHQVAQGIVPLVVLALLLWIAYRRLKRPDRLPESPSTFSERTTA